MAFFRASSSCCEGVLFKYGLQTGASRSETQGGLITVPWSLHLLVMAWYVRFHEAGELHGGLQDVSGFEHVSSRESNSLASTSNHSHVGRYVASTGT